jgi:hypothetical protein
LLQNEQLQVETKLKPKFVTNEPLTSLFAGLKQLEVQFVAKFTSDLPGCKLRAA